MVFGNIFIRLELYLFIRLMDLVGGFNTYIGCFKVALVAFSFFFFYITLKLCSS